MTQQVSHLTYEIMHNYAVMVTDNIKRHYVNKNMSGMLEK
jgi:hypothetical protein